MTMAPSATNLMLSLSHITDTASKPQSLPSSTSVPGKSAPDKKPQQTRNYTTQKSVSKRVKPDASNKKITGKQTEVEKRQTVTAKPDENIEKENTVAQRALEQSPDIETTQTTTNSATNSPTTTRMRPDEQQTLNARIQKQLSLRIAFNQYYPRIAVRNAWEGQVNLSIRVLASGELTNIHVIDSSGHNLLDKAAVKSVVRIASLPQARAWLQGRDINVILPIIYKLTDS